MNDKILLALDVAMRFLGLPYRWGGDDPIQGFDCSGFVIEILKSVGILPRDGDWTADGLMRLFPAAEKPSAGCLMLVCNSAGKATHVEFCIDSEHTIGASGGGSATTSEAAAISQNAYIKVRPIRTGSSIRYVNPFH